MEQDEPKPGEVAGGGFVSGLCWTVDLHGSSQMLVQEWCWWDPKVAPWASLQQKVPSLMPARARVRNCHFQQEQMARPEA